MQAKGFSRKNVRKAEKNAQKLSVAIYSVFVAFVISREPSACTTVEHVHLGKTLFC